MKKIFAALLSVSLLSACQNGGPVPEDWYKLPENGNAARPGSVDELGKTFRQLLVAQSAALAPIKMPAPTPQDPSAVPVDWVPWHLAMLFGSFGITTDGVFGALSSEGSAAVQAKWVRADTDTHATLHFDNPAPKKSDLLLHGTESLAQVRQRVEPSIQRAFASGTVQNRQNFRATVLTLAENFHAVAHQLSALDLGAGSFKPTAFRLEVNVDVNGNITKVITAGTTVKLRFDWIIRKDDSAPSQQTVNPQSLQAAQSMESFVRSFVPDLNAAADASGDPEKDGYKLASVRVGLGLTADMSFAVADGSTGAVASIIFGDNADEGGCPDSDSDEDCEGRSAREFSAPATLNSTTPGLPVLVSPENLSKLQYARTLGLAPKLARSFDAPEDRQVFTIPHDKVQAGLKRAIGMSRFFTGFASEFTSGWKIKEIETEFSLSLSGKLGMATVGAGPEVELEFEKAGD